MTSHPLTTYLGHDCLMSIVCYVGLNTDVMTRLLGPADTETRKNNKQMRGLCYAVLCNGYRPSAAQTRTIDTLLVAWHLTEAWLPGRVGHKAKLQMLQVRQ